MNYTLVGAVANLASRLEGLNKVYGTDILASGEVAGPTASRFVWRRVDRIVAAGTTEVLELHELRGVGSDECETAFLALWELGQDAYRDRRFAEAARHLTRALELRPDDGPCRIFIRRCDELARNNPPDDWNGVWHFDVK